jgi:hypothetical protein
MKTIIVLAAACLAGCAAQQPDTYCVSRESVPVTIAGQQHQATGGCTEWRIGPSRKQVEAFDRRAGIVPQK